MTDYFKKENITLQKCFCYVYFIGHVLSHRKKKITGAFVFIPNE